MNARLAYGVLAVFLGVLLGMPNAAQAAKAQAKLSSSCVDSSAYKELEKCPGGPKKFNIKKKRSAAFKAKPPPRTAKKSSDSKPTNPTEEMAAGQRDTRKTRLKARARALLITEIQGLERLFKRTPKKSPDRPQLVRRLAEGYVELETAADRDKIEAEIKAQDLKRKKGSQGAINKQRKEAAKAKKILSAARKKAIAYYTLMKNAYPNYSKIDEVMYYLAYEWERANNFKKARTVYLELIQKAPKSPYIPNAYLAFGELFFIEAQADPANWDLARDSYKEVIKYPPPKNKVFGYARYKLGYVHWNKGDFTLAINEFKKVIEYGDQYRNLPNAKQLQKSARRDIIPVYAAAGRADKAYGFFKPLSGDKTGDKKTFHMLRELGHAYIDTGHYKEAITLYQDLKTRDPGDYHCFYQSQITQAIAAINSSNKPRIVKELENQLATRNEFVKDKHSSKSKLECSNKTAELLSETAMSWHLEAVGSGGVRGTGDEKTMDLAAKLYKRVVENFTAKDFAKFKFPRIIKEDWPNIYKIKYAMADLLYFRQRWEDCGPAFDSVVAEDPTAPEAAEAAYASVLCYQKMYDQLYKGESDRKGKGLGPKGASKEDQKGQKGEWEKLKPKEFTDLQKGMLTAFNRYVCYILPPKGDANAEEQYVEVKFGRARTYFEAQHWDKAAIAFRDVAINHSDKDAGIYAAQLYLESINVLGAKSEPPKPSCFDDMGKDVPVFLDLYCKGDKFEDNKEQCELLTRIQCDIKRLKAQKTVELADSAAEKNDNSTALTKYKEGGDAYLDLWRTYGEKQLQAGEESQCGKMDEIVYNMARAYQAGRLLAKSIQARLILLDTRYGMNESELAKKATYEIGGNYQAIAVYDRAADFYERYAKITKFKGEFADKALSDAVVLRLGLGQEEKAIEDAKNFNRYHGRRKPQQAAQIAFAVAAHYGEKKDWNQVTRRLAGAIRLIDTKADMDIRAQAHALLGRAYVKLNRGRNADIEYGKVTALWKDPNKAVKQIEASEGDAASKQRRLGRALTAVGEALFYESEKKRKKVEAVKFPEYKGKFTAKKPGQYAGSYEWQTYLDAMKKEKAAIQDHIKTKVAGWMKKKKPLIEDASKDYKRIVDLQPVPPPIWVIAAGSRVGNMWGTFVKEFRAAPIPSYMKEDDELRNAYYASLDNASEPMKQIAKGAYKTCLDYSVKYQYFDEFSRTCEEWLAENYKAEFHLIDEFRGAPNKINSTLKERAYPVQIGGDPFVIITEKRKAERLNKDEDEKKK